MIETHLVALTLRASLSGTFLRPRMDVVNQCLEFDLVAATEKLLSSFSGVSENKLFHVVVVH